MTPTRRAIEPLLLFAIVVLGSHSARAATHCGLDAGTAPSVKMWDLQPASDRKTTRELIVSIVKSHEFYRACMEHGLTIVLRIAHRQTIETVYFIKD